MKHSPHERVSHASQSVSQSIIPPINLRIDSDRVFFLYTVTRVNDRLISEIVNVEVEGTNGSHL